MSKYDFQLDLSQNSSTGIILSKIKKGSVVLEFGCSTGRMTRYMKEVLECRVYIVEYDAEAYEKARRYADGGLCEDIQTFRWSEQFKNLRFDAIIFADVLEHVTAPEKVLRCAAELLKDSGCIHVSIPNITHNDIVMKAYAEHFDYTSTGLLDDTHVHFWGMENLRELGERCGLRVGTVEATYCPTGATEQFGGRQRRVSLLLENILKERQCGEVYQFVMSLYKSGDAEPHYVFRCPTIQSRVYLDTGNDFNSDEIIYLNAEYSGHGSYTVSCVIEETNRLCRVRFDPVEQQGCLLSRIKIYQGERSLELQYLEGAKIASGLLLPGEDPMVYAEISERDLPIRIEAEIVLWGEFFLELVEKECVSLAVRCEKLAAYGEQVQILARENARLKENIARLSSEKEELCQDLGAYITLVHGKDMYALSLEQELDRYRSRKLARLRGYVIRILKGGKRKGKQIIKKILKRIVKRGED